MFEFAQVEGGRHVRGADLSKTVHAHQEFAERFLGAIKMREQRAIPTVGLLPAVRPFPDGVFEIPPHAPHHVVGIVHVARQAIGALAAQVSRCFGSIRVIGPFLSQQFEADARVEQAF
jgi:hypothetical protein